MRDNRELMRNILNIEELIEEVGSLEKILKEKFIEIVEGQMDWARLRHTESLSYYIKTMEEREELNDFHSKLGNILEKLYRTNEYEVGKIVSLKLEFERAYSDLRQNVNLYDSLDNEQLKLF